MFEIPNLILRTVKANIINNLITSMLMKKKLTTKV